MAAADPRGASPSTLSMVALGAAVGAAVGIAATRLLLRSSPRMRGSRSAATVAKRIILVRHGQSEGNANRNVYAEVPDWKIALTPLGREQAVEAGRRIKEIIGDEPVLFFVSPYERTKQTFEGIASSLSPAQLVKIREEPRIREQEFGNLQDAALLDQLHDERNEYGSFFYRNPDGESGADVYDRVTTFLETLWRVFAEDPHCTPDTNVVLVTHGLTLRLFLMRWFHWPVGLFHTSSNPKNCEFVVMERCSAESATPMSYRIDDKWLRVVGLTNEMVVKSKPWPDFSLRKWGGPDGAGRASGGGAAGGAGAAQTTPFLLRVFVHPKGSGARVAVVGEEPRAIETDLHTWRDATLGELADLLRETHDAARKEGARMTFTALHPSDRGQYLRRDLGVVTAGRAAPADARTLHEARFEIGDLLDVALDA